MTAKQIEIFKPFTGKDRRGTDVSFSASDVEDMASVYDPKLYEAPLVVGHPQNDHPAYGWVASLEFSDGALCAAPHQIDPEFSEMVNAGRFKRVSASFFAPTSPSNPVPGHFYLKHVGFLGAKAPAVKGLKTVSFAAADEGVVEVEFSDFSARSVAGMLRGLRDWLIGKYGQDEADKALPGYEIDWLRDDAARTDTAFSSHETDQGEIDMNPNQAAREAELKEREQTLAAREAAIKAKEVEFSEVEKRARVKENEALVDALIAGGRLIPTERSQELAFMESLPAAGETVEFSEPDGKSVKLSPLAAYRKRLEARPKLVEFAEVVPGGKIAADTLEFSAAGGFEVDRGRLGLHQAATAYQRKHPEVDFITAYKAVGGK